MTGRRGRRVLMIVENNSVPFDRRVWQEAEALRDAGFQVTVIAPRGTRTPRLRETIDGIRVLRHPRGVEADRAWEYVLEYANALVWEILLALAVRFTRGVDVVHIANPPDSAFIVGGLLRLLGAKVVFDQHDLGPEIFEVKFSRGGLLWRLVMLFERASYRAAHVVITSNGSMKQAAIDRGGREAGDVFVVRNGPDLERFSTEGTEDSLKNGRRYMVCYLGIIGAQEGLDGLVRVVEDIAISRNRHDIQFVVIGDGTALAEVEELARDRGVGDFVTFTGYLTGTRLVQALNTADVCVCPEPPTTLNDRSTLVKTMEYMAMEKPVALYDLTESRITAGDAALYAEPGNELHLAHRILELVDDAELRAELGGRGAERVRTALAWHHQVPHLLDAYAKALSGGGRSRRRAPVDDTAPRR